MYFWKKLYRLLGDPLLESSESEYSKLLEELPGQPTKCREYYRMTRSYSPFACIRRLWCNSLHVGSYKLFCVGVFGLYNCCNTYIEISPPIQRNHSVALVSNSYGFVGRIVIMR